ncbi:MAG: WD40/YVTN/BNR-like repeat-containing protein [Dehalococcoidia bacterium]
MFIDQQNGFVYGPDLYTTHDGGQTWDDSTSHAVLQLALVGSAVWALEGPCDIHGSCNSTLMISSDTGRTWRAAPSQPPNLPNAILVSQNNSDVWLFGGAALYEAPVANADGHLRLGTLVHTADAGQHWDSVGLSPCGGSLVALTGGQMWLVCAGQSTQGVQDRWVFVSDDGGRNWRPVVAGGPLSAWSNGYARGLAAASPDRVFIIGSRVGLLRSDDGGATWHEVLPDDSGNGFTAIVFVDAVHGWAVNTSGASDSRMVWRTVDGGTIWTAYQLPS